MECCGWNVALLPITFGRVALAPDDGLLTICHEESSLGPAAHSSIVEFMPTPPLLLLLVTISSNDDDASELAPSAVGVLLVVRVVRVVLAEADTNRLGPAPPLTVSFIGDVVLLLYDRLNFSMTSSSEHSHALFVAAAASTAFKSKCVGFIVAGGTNLRV